MAIVILGLCRTSVFFSSTSLIFLRWYLIDIKLPLSLWLVKWITLRQSEVRVQLWCNPLWLSWLKATTNLLTLLLWRTVSVSPCCCGVLLALVLVVVADPRSGELRTQKLKSYLVRTQSLNVLNLKPGVGRYVAIHTTLNARDFLLISTLPIHSLAFFPKPLPIFPVLAVANTMVPV